MDKLNTSGISDPGKLQPLLGPSIEFIQNAYKTALNLVAGTFVGNSYSGANVYVGYGAIDSGTSISNGAVFFGGEWYILTGANYSGYVNVPVMIADNSNGTADPITYSDSTTGNVHNVRKMKIVDQVSGTGLADYSSFIFIQSADPVTVGSGGSAPAFQNTYNYSGQLVKFRKNKEGLVTIQGKATLGAGTYASTIFTLPSGYRPSEIRATLVAVDSGLGFKNDLLTVDTSGNVGMTGYISPTGTTYVFINICFYAD